MSYGYTLLEMLAVLTLFAVTVASAAPALRSYADDARSVAAREAVAGAIARARVLAVGRGGATVTLRTDPAAVSISIDDSLVHMRRLGSDTGVALDLGGRDDLALRFDRLGLGRFASATIGFRTGESERSLVVSSYGRVSRR